MAESSKNYNLLQNIGNYELYHQMRTEDPVHCMIGPMTGNRVWVITGYNDTVTVIKHPKIGKMVKRHLPPELAAKWDMPDPFGLDEHLLALDPPDHTRLRTLVTKAFTRASIRKMEGRIVELCDEILDEYAGVGEMDVMSQFALVLPVRVIAEILGLPGEDSQRFHDWTKQMLFDEDMEERKKAGESLVGYLNELLEERAANPRDDLLSRLVHAEEEGDKLTRKECLSMLYLLLVAGHETTTSLIGNGTVALLRNPDQLQLLKDNIDDQKLIDNMIEEMLRFDGPAATTFLRFAFDDIELGGKTIKKGDGVTAVFHAANRDPEVFPDPDKFDIQRENASAHVGFGGGIHYCLGAPLARLEGGIAVPRLIQRFPDLTLASDDLSYDNRAFHGFKSIPIRFTPTK